MSYMATGTVSVRYRCVSVNSKNLQTSDAVVSFKQCCGAGAAIFKGGFDFLFCRSREPEPPFFEAAPAASFS